jgi:hypothetical protein
MSRTEDSQESLTGGQKDVARLLRNRFTEIERLVFERVRNVPLGEAGEDADYVVELRNAVAAALDFCLEALEHNSGWRSSIPPVTAVQARRAARKGVDLGVVLRGYATGDRALAEFIAGELDHFPSGVLPPVLKALDTQADRLMAAATAEYLHERSLMERSHAQEIAERVQRLLAGDRSAEREIDYPINWWHVGLITTGEKGEVWLLETAAKLGCEALLLTQDEGTVWAWLGRLTPPALGEIERALGADRTGLSAAAGEPRQGFEGWCLTHQEAKAGLEILRRSPQRFVRGSNVALTVAVLRDEALRESLQETFLAPLDRGGRGSLLRETLYAYFAADGNEVAAAAALRVNRQTVHRRLGKVEEMLGRLLHTCRPELEVLLSLQRLCEQNEEAL